MNRALVILLFLSSTAGAAFPARVDTDTAEVFAAPNPKASVLTVIRKGTPLAVSNLPIEGFYKVRMPNGEIGWVSAEILVVYPRPTGETIGDLPQGDKNELRARASKLDFSPSHETIDFRAIVGLGFFTLSEVGSSTGFGDLGGGLHFGGEVQVMFSRGFGIAFRGEYITKSTVGADAATSNEFTFDVKSIPVMGGFIFGLSRSEKASLKLGLYGGVALSTELSSTSANDTAPNVTTYQQSGITGLAALSLRLRLTKTMSLFGEGGFRYLNTTAAAATTVGNGSSVFTTDPPINLTGAFAGGGLAILF